MNLTCMSRSYEDKSIGISYSVIFALCRRMSDVSVMCNAHAPAPGRLSSAHCNESTDDCYGYIEIAECECEDIMNICLLVVSGSSLN